MPSCLPFLLRVWTTGLVLVGLSLAASAGPPEKAQPILTIDQVRVGMKGYGLTVFHGTQIEPFNVEVVSINANETPGMAVIWVRCPDERMVFTGPVQGMSGSPIYLWDEDEEHTLGEGGKLIGAFAFGYGDTNDCIIGVQPIEQMRAVGRRATAEDRPEMASLAPAGSGYKLMAELFQVAEANALSPLTRARLDMMTRLYREITPANARRAGALALLKQPGGSNLTLDRQDLRMLMPLGVASPEIAAVLSPTLEPMGIKPFATDPTALGGPPPQGIETESVQLEPGSALVVPFAWGDADLMGIGTVTDVLPDGTVLGFGHAMDGVGVTAMPMATGYVHFIVSLRTISYKRGGTLEMAGTLVQDEQAAVAGVEGEQFTSAPVKVVVNIEGQPSRTYDYQVLNHPSLTPQIAAAVIVQSATTVQETPARSTMSYTAKATFSGDRELTLDSADLNTGGMGAATDMVQLIGAITQNPFEKVTLEGLEVEIDIDYGMEAWQINSVRLDRATAAPGETVNAIVEFMGLEEQPFTRSYPIRIPDDAAEGEQQIVVGDAATYTQFSLAARPYLAQVDSVDDLLAVYRELLSISPRKLYTMVPTKRAGIALDGQPLPNLPGSRAALLASANPGAVAFQTPAVENFDTERLIVGGAQVKLTIQRPRGGR
ncbi:MAG: hypothetical protein AAGC44_10955 [Planctomycetota bacterium]